MNKPGGTTSIPDRKYSNPPVVEALCEIYFTGSKWDSTIPGLFLNEIRAEYPEVKELQQMEVKLPPQEQTVPVQKVGTRTQFIHNSKARIVQIEPDLLVINQLRPYPRFTTWQPTIGVMLRHYVSLARPTGIKRVGVRYINNIVLTPPPLKMMDVCKIYPEIPEGFDRGRFMLRMDVRPHHQDHTLVLTFGLESIQHEKPAKLLFDLYDTKVLNAEFSIPAIESTSREAHENIVVAFEGSLTDTARTLFEKNGGKK